MIVPIATVFCYSLSSSPTEYAMSIVFDGYLPVLGGMQQKAKVELSLKVTGKESGGELSAETSLSGLKLSLLDATTGKFEPFELGLQSVKAYFPDSSIRYTKEGKIVSTTAPEFSLPIRLPGLHTQHVPDISFMSVEFPAGGVEAGTPWTFVRKFGDSEVKTTAVYAGKDDRGERFDLDVSQEYSTFEDEFRNAVADRSKAKTKVVTKVSGKGKVWFSGPKGTISRSEMLAAAESRVYTMSGEPSGDPRRLAISFEMEQKGK